MPELIDTTVASNFAAVEQLDLIRRALGEVMMANAVYEEVQRGIIDGYGFLHVVDDRLVAVQHDGWIRLTDLETLAERERYASLIAIVQPGEAASIAIAAERGWTFATDDRAARLVAAREGVPVTGTLGILLQLIDSGELTFDEANRLLGLMIDRARYRSPVSDLRALLEPQ